MIDFEKLLLANEKWADEQAKQDLHFGGLAVPIALHLQIE